LEPFILVVEQEGPAMTFIKVRVGPSCSTTNGQISKSPSGRGRTTMDENAPACRFAAADQTAAL